MELGEYLNQHYREDIFHCAGVNLSKRPFLNVAGKADLFPARDAFICCATSDMETAHASPEIVQYQPRYNQTKWRGLG